MYISILHLSYQALLLMCLLRFYHGFRGCYSSFSARMTAIHTCTTIRRHGLHVRQPGTSPQTQDGPKMAPRMASKMAPPRWPPTWLLQNGPSKIAPPKRPLQFVLCACGCGLKCSKITKMLCKSTPRDIKNKRKHAPIA